MNAESRKNFITEHILNVFSLVTKNGPSLKISGIIFSSNLLFVTKKAFIESFKNLQECVVKYEKSCCTVHQQKMRTKCVSV